jgi:hypothetical protein
MPGVPDEPGMPDPPEEPTVELAAGVPSTSHFFVPEHAAVHVPLLPHAMSSDALVSPVMLQPPPAHARVHVAPLAHVIEQLPPAQSKLQVLPAAHVNWQPVPLAVSHLRLQLSLQAHCCPLLEQVSAGEVLLHATKTKRLAEAKRTPSVRPRRKVFMHPVSAARVPQLTWAAARVLRAACDEDDAIVHQRREGVRHA